MGQQQSFSNLSEIMTDERVLPFFTEELHTLTYEKFIAILGELNNLSGECFHSDKEKLIFAVKKGTDSTIFWKATIQIACVKLNSTTQKITSYRLLNLYEFLKVCKTLKGHSSVQELTKRDGINITQVFETLEEDQGETIKECCICLERKHEVILPCTHSFCLPCIEHWNSLDNTCPICREKLDSTDDAWIISDVPESDEICKELKSNLIGLSDEKKTQCVTS